MRKSETDNRPRKTHYPHHMFSDQAACGRDRRGWPTRGRGTRASLAAMEVAQERDRVTCGACLQVMANHPAYQAA